VGSDGSVLRSNSITPYGALPLAWAADSIGTSTELKRRPIFICLGHVGVEIIAALKSVEVSLYLSGGLRAVYQGLYRSAPSGEPVFSDCWVGEIQNDSELEDPCHDFLNWEVDANLVDEHSSMSSASKDGSISWTAST
jgi:hypothetical protein